jgi:ABC-type lipoprotein release transport system permease subunit
MTGSKSWGRLKLISGAPLTHLGSNEILINHWAAQDLEVEVGDTITLTYYIPDWQETLNTRSSSFRLKGIVPMEGVAIDETLAPEITGIQDAKDIASWDPPIPIDYSLIRKRDEEYWDHYRAAPKAFLPYEAGVELWRNRFGRTTSVRFPNEGWALQEIESCLLQKLRSEQIGRFRATREEDLQAATGSTDFGMLFIGFSFFLIISSMLLVGLLFRLGVENRAPELGLLLSLGYPSRDVRRRFLIEGSVLAVAGSLVGLALACVYAGLLIAGLRTVWVAAIGSSFLRLHVSLETLIVGFFASLAAVLLSLLLTFRALLKFPATSLLSGTIKRSGPVHSLWARIVLAISFGLAVLLLLSSFVILHKSSPIIFFLVGALLLISGLASFALWLRSESTSPIGSKPFAPGIELAARNSARSPGRSLLSVALVATACFVIVSVGANRSLPGAEVLDKDSGAGGFAARAQSDVPLVRDLNNPDVLFDLGFAETDVAKLDNVRFAAYRFRPGEDISCRNLYRPREPRLLGVSQKGIQRGGFRFQTAIRDVENPWTLLNDDLGKGILPAIADVNSATWILQLSLGDDLILKDANGEEIRLRLVGLLARSIFQSELLISETNFEKHFPEQRGHSYFLLEMPFDQFDEMTSVLERVLGRYGFDIHRTDRLLAGFLAIQNTYLSTFQSLGGLGLLLGTAGLGIILIRNTIERRSELAVLRAFGFRRRKLASLVLLENSFLLGLGIVLGSAAALIAVAPHVVTSSEDIPVISLAITLVVVFAFGFIVNLAALRFALRTPLLAALREE